MQYLGQTWSKIVIHLFAIPIEPVFYLATLPLSPPIMSLLATSLRGSPRPVLLLLFSSHRPSSAWAPRSGQWCPQVIGQTGALETHEAKPNISPNLAPTPIGFSPLLPSKFRKDWQEVLSPAPYSVPPVDSGPSIWSLRRSSVLASTPPREASQGVALQERATQPPPRIPTPLHPGLKALQGS